MCLSGRALIYADIIRIGYNLSNNQISFLLVSAQGKNRPDLKIPQHCDRFLFINRADLDYLVGVF